MQKASWIILTLIGALTMAGSLVSLVVAYTSITDQIGPATLDELSAGRPDIAIAVRARRATAAAYGAGFATLFLAITLGPYRREEVWAWWAILAGTLVVSGLILLRVPLLGIQLGTAAAVTGAGTALASLVQLAVTGLGLALGSRRLATESPIVRSSQ